MASQRELSLCDVLCFVSNKFVKLPVKQLKSMLSDFYAIEALTEAKVRLLSDIEKAEPSVQIPHMPRRRDGDNRAAREVDDIVTLFQFVDENKLLTMLPMYVSGNPDLMPSARLFEGDLNILMVKLEKMGYKVDEFGSALSAIGREVGELQSKFMSLDEFPPCRLRSHLCRYNHASCSLNNHSQLVGKLHMGSASVMLLMMSSVVHYSSQVRNCQRLLLHRRQAIGMLCWHQLTMTVHNEMTSSRFQRFDHDI